MATVDVLADGYARREGEVAHVAGTVALTHLWWHAGMEGDPRAVDLDALHRGRARVLEVADRIVPGHGPAFDVTADTPR